MMTYVCNAGVEMDDDLPMKVIETQNPNLFFFQSDLYPGKTMNVKFDKSEESQSKPQPQNPLYFIALIKNMNKEGYTFNELCVKQKASMGEHKYCARSLRTLMDFVISRLGKNVEPLSSAFIGKEEEYSVEGVQNLGVKTVMCHRLNFIKTTLYCHDLNKITNAFKVSLVAADGTKTQALAVCHGNTSEMNRHYLHKILKANDPGTTPVCHFLGNKSILWVPNTVLDIAARPLVM